MNKQAHRRAFLVRVAVGAGAVAGAGVAPDASAQSRAQEVHQHSGAFFNQDDAATVAALAERIMPGAPGKPGAKDAGVVNYIDLALSGAYADLQDFYRRGLAQLDGLCQRTYHEAFRRLDAARQDEVIAALEQGRATGFDWPPAEEFFTTLRTHTMEGMFADPIYGGNHDFAGWRLVGFPGAQAIFTPPDMQSKEAFTREPIIGLQAAAPKRKG